MIIYKKKWIAAVVLTGFLFFCFAGTIYGISTSANITQRELESPNTKANRESIAQKILRDTGNTDRFEPADATNIIIAYGDVLGDETNEAVINLELGSKNSIVSVYERDGNEYKYAGNLGDFFYIRTIEFLPIENNKEIILLREYANQNIGAFERSSFIIGYLWDGNRFREVLNIPEGIEAVWNDLWDNSTQDGNSRWNKIEQRTDIEFSRNGNPILNLNHYQAHRVTDERISTDVPDNNDYDTVSNRVVSETYYWNPEWNLFILSEMQDNRTGERVAVIEDLASSPYALLSDYGDIANRVRIERKDGTIETVDKTSLSPIDGSPTANVFIAY